MNNSVLSAMYLRKSRADDPHEAVMETLHRHESILRAVAKRGKYLVPEDCIYREVVSGENIFSRRRWSVCWKTSLTANFNRL